jgi:hypothetical protein
VTTKASTKASKKGQKAAGKPKRVQKQFAMAVAAAPVILTPTANSYVLPGVDLFVQCQTNRPDLSYIVTLTDVTVGAPGPLPPPSMRMVPAPSGFNFGVIFPGATLQPNHVYRLRVFAGGGGGLDHSITVHTRQPIGWRLITEPSETPFNGYHTDDE